jgi:hypothetical protein
LVPASQLPSYVDDVVEAPNSLGLPTTGEFGKIYVTLNNGKIFRWSGSTYVEISASPGSTDAVPEGSNLYHTTARAAAAAPVQSVAGKTGAVSLVKADVGLDQVDNTSDSTKPVSTPQAAALALKANLASPTFTGTVSGITATMIGLGSVSNTSDLAKPVSLAQQTALNLKANIASPTFTGTVSGITAAMVGLGNVPNTDATSRANHTGTQIASTISDFAAAAVSATASRSIAFAIAL